MNDTIEIHEEKDEGFTLVELLIVIVILGILATVTVFAVGGITSTAEDNACKTERATVQTAAEAYFVDNAAYPATTDDLVSEYLREDPATEFTFTVTAGVLTVSACP